MTPSFKPWLPVDRIAEWSSLEPLAFLLGFALVSWALYKLVFKTLAPHRHVNLRGQFRNLLKHFGLLGLLFIPHFSLQVWGFDLPAFDRVSAYLGLAIIVYEGVIFVKICRILSFEYLFFKHMKEGVPLLLVNLVSLIISIVLIMLMLTEVLGIKVAPVLATSAIFSIVLGLALQDTIGNLFAGVALHFDKPFELDDWIEVNTGSSKIVGQVLEVSWRATVLQSFTDEIITIPNKVISQSQLSNYSTRVRPIIRSQSFRVPFDADLDRVRYVLKDAVKDIPELRKDPSTVVIFTEISDSWIVAKLIYYINDFGLQYLIADKVIERCLGALREEGLRLAPQRYAIEQVQQSSS